MVISQHVYLSYIIFNSQNKKNRTVAMTIEASIVMAKTPARIMVIKEVELETVDAVKIISKHLK